MSDLPAVSVEMQGVLDGAREAGNAELEGRALTALAEVTLLRDADLPRATELIEEALVALPTDGRFGALEVRGHIAHWLGDVETHERMADEMLAIARRLDRPDLEAQAVNELSVAYRQQNRLAEAQELLDRAVHLAEASGSILARAQARHSLGIVQLDRGELDAAEQSLEQARELFGEVGDTWRLARTMNELARVAEERGDDARAEKLLRDAIKMLKMLGDRGALCESQRGLAEILVNRGRLDEAERVALEAIETVGEHDYSSRATTAMTLAVVRIAQGRDAEAEEQMLASIAFLEETGFRGLEIWALRRYDEFLHERGRDADAVAYRARLAELVPAEGMAMAFANRMDRIA
jgi:tetratricopeptide (TPR) repeat protein